jgi:hypothetical protein
MLPVQQKPPAQRSSVALAIVTAGLIAMSCRDERVPGPAAAMPGPSAAAASDPLLDPQRFDLIDMLPGRAGGLALVGADAAKGRGSYHPPAAEEAAVGYYDWVRLPGAQVDSLPVATEFRSPTLTTVTCQRASTGDAADDCTDKDSKRITVGGKPGCFWPEERNCGRGGRMAAMVTWPGCRIKFVCGDLAGPRAALAKAATLAAAADIERWAVWFRRGRPAGAEPSDLRAHRQALLGALTAHDEWRRREPGRRTSF